jgi:alpha-L-fucosidase 2
MRRRIAAARAKLPPPRLNPDGRMLEWAEPYTEAEPGHRHMSHLIGLHPFDLITRQTPELFDGARKTIDYRLAHGSGGTGWSRAWMVNFLARLQDGDEAYHHYLGLLRDSTLPNLFDNCPPFQIDGNFGGAAGFCEMLLQSHERLPGSGPADQKFVIRLLPALPKAWANGTVKGLCARGGFTVDMDWQGGKLTHGAIHSANGGDCQVRWNQTVVDLKTKRGESYPLSF